MTVNQGGGSDRDELVEEKMMTRRRKLIEKSVAHVLTAMFKIYALKMRGGATVSWNYSD